METQEILSEIKDAEMVLVGLGEDFDDIEKLQTSEEYKDGREFLQQNEGEWLLPAWREYCSARLGENTISPALEKLSELIKEKNYFIVSTATDSRISAVAWKKGRLVMPCGSTAYKKCVNGCGSPLKIVSQKDKDELKKRFDEMFLGQFTGDNNVLEKCAQCGSDMELNSVCAKQYDESGYLEQWKTYMAWLQGTMNRKLLVMELGVGMKYPSVVRWPFEKVVFYQNKAKLIRVNKTLWQLTEELAGKGCGIPQNAIAWLSRL